MTKSRIFWGTLAPVAAILSSLVFVYIILTIRGVNPIDIFSEMISYGFQPRNLVSELNQTIAYYMAGVAAAIGFKMLLFNIGIDGQFAPWVGAMIPDIKQEILLVCEEGREEEVITRLARVGYDHTIGYLKGGFAAWKQAGKET